MPTATFTQNLKIGSVTINKTISRTADHESNHEVALPAAQAVTAWVKTDANTAACNLAGGHGQTNGKFDVYWTGGKRTGVDGLITVNALALDGGSGTDFPASATAGVTVCKQVAITPASIDGDALSIIGICLAYAVVDAAGVGYLDLLDVGNGSVGTPLSLVANAPLVCDVTGGNANTFTGNPITHATASHSDAVNAATLQIASLGDSTP